MFCRNCGNKVPDDISVCIKCGCRPLMGNSFCQNCGAPTVPQQVMCTKCRATLKSAEVPTKDKQETVNKVKKAIDKVVFVFVILMCILSMIARFSFFTM